ncbi:pentapeptide repeat-containing protein [Leptolyngbya cf. ectocarpi LEGE 11479]|uniref:Pentapeptide repeat-containing protein n=1 Tax=Leptolyngbya cf. ectocarpi LEGE 11479 TaxID=1828722 RepID=A0A928ZWI3_LEPEC|nr:pentapeptide repeat-containing protein [Leptolyngbya ectocarpi]MBE9068718.1 pentapeptide repeat-containing protein [Leptolyngbya cf. ectocarpi LEGE 11479]
MANAEHLELIKQGVEVWNQWREKNPDIVPDLSQIKLDGVDLREANLHGAQLSAASLRGVILCGADLRGGRRYREELHRGKRISSKLFQAKLGFTELDIIDLRDNDLSKADLRRVNLSKAILFGVDFQNANFSGVDLRDADLCAVDLREAKLYGARLGSFDLSDLDLNGLDLHGVDLCNADLSRTQALRTNFERAILTGACLEDWHINSATKFDGVICEYVYLKTNQQERRPREGRFKPGEFSALFQQAVDTVDLIFKDGIDWQAFFQSFQDLRSQYEDQDLSIQAIEKKRGGAFVVRLEVAEGADKALIESSAKELYLSEIKALEAQYEERLRLQGQHLDDSRQTIEVERRDKASLMAVMSTMASTQQGPKYDLRNAQFVGGFAETVHGDQVGGTINNQATETPSLAEAAAEIQNLLKQLEASNPIATEAEQTAFLNVMIPPTRRERLIGALKAAGGEAIEKVPYGAVLKALVEGWQEPNG